MTLDIFLDRRVGYHSCLCNNLRLELRLIAASYMNEVRCQQESRFKVFGLGFLSL